MSQPTAPSSGCIVIPFVEQLELTDHALGDALTQLGGDVRVLLINNGGALPPGALTRRFDPRVLYWHHSPPLAALAATWNFALDTAWALGFHDCMVWNNDIRVQPDMYADLRSYAAQLHLDFATPVNTRDQEQDPDVPLWQQRVQLEGGPQQLRRFLGGPDFSCFYITRELHADHRFDPRFRPAYFEDGDYHRRLWLAGDGRRIAGLPLPYLHLGSQTIRRDAEAAREFAPKFEACKAAYIRKWGGPPHQERRVTSDSAENVDSVGTPGGWLGGKPWPMVDPDSGQVRWFQHGTDPAHPAVPDLVLELPAGGPRG